MFSFMALAAGIVLVIVFTSLLLRSAAYITLVIFGVGYTLVFIVLPSLKAILAPDMPAYVALMPIDIDALYESSLAIALYGVIIAAVGYILGTCPSRIQTNTCKWDSSAKTTLRFSFLITLVGAVLMIFASGMSLADLVVSSRFAYWATRNKWLFLIGQYLAGMAMVEAYLLGITRTRYNRVYWLGPILVVLEGLFLFGNRAQPIGVVAAFLLARYLRHRRQLSRVTFRRILLSGAVISLVGYVSVAWQVVRWRKQDGLGAMLSELLNVDRVLSEVLFQGDAMYFFNAFVAARQLVPSVFDYLYGSTYYRLFLLPIPHSLFPSLKPEETQRIFAFMLNPTLYEQGATFPPSLLGDFHLNFGPLGYFLMFPAGWVLGRLTVWALRNPLSIVTIPVLSGLPLFILLALRGTIMNGLLPLISNLLVLVMYYSGKTLLQRAPHHTKGSIGQKYWTCGPPGGSTPNR